jgi:hypothetical protein
MTTNQLIDSFQKFANRIPPRGNNRIYIAETYTAHNSLFLAKTNWIHRDPMKIYTTIPSNDDFIKILISNKIQNINVVPLFMSSKMEPIHSAYINITHLQLTPTKWRPFLQRLKEFVNYSDLRFMTLIFQFNHRQVDKFVHKKIAPIIGMTIRHMYGMKVSSASNINDWIYVCEFDYSQQPCDYNIFKRHELINGYVRVEWEGFPDKKDNTWLPITELNE